VHALVRKARRFQGIRSERGLGAACSDAAQGLGASALYRLLIAGRAFHMVPDSLWMRCTGDPALAGYVPESERLPATDYLPLPPTPPAHVAPLPDTVTVVLPVYRGVAETRACIDSVLAAHNETRLRLLVVDDAAPEPALRKYLASLEGVARVRVLSNERNLGFVGSVARGMAAAADDVVLLNSDTLVTDGWLDDLGAHASSAEWIGTVTPFSNNATICSYPDIRTRSALPPGETLAQVAAAFRSANRGRSVEIPTAVGFCMWISRRCLEDVGGFDVAAFGMGYGEENDFCLRAATRGWKHLLAADVFVWHAGEVSFGPQAAAEREAGMAVLKARYPEYLDTVASWVRRDPARAFRAAATAVRFRDQDRAVLLHITHDLGGGTERHVRDIAGRFAGDVRSLVLRPLGGRLVSLTSLDEWEGIDLLFAAGEDDAFLADLLAAFGVDRVHIHHLMHMTADVRRLVERLGAPFDFTVHDYFTICPRTRLMMPGAGYCGGPQAGRCRRCLADGHPFGARDIGVWQSGFAWLYAGAERVICPSGDVAARVAAAYPDARIVVVPHSALDGAVWPAPRPAPLGGDEALRVAVLGTLSTDKGAATVFDCVTAAARRGLPIEITLIGSPAAERPALVPPPGLRVTGAYQAADLPGLLRDIAPHIVWFPSRAPETYSYTLSEALQAALPVLVPDLGSFPERVAGRSWSWIAPLDPSVEDVLAIFVRIREDVLSAQAAVAPMTPGAGVAITDFYDGAYADSLHAARRGGA
jgi:GT2 family glycosyltransferase/glycosyltransferase involved in cell wall biosynthesis